MDKNDLFLKKFYNNNSIDDVKLVSNFKNYRTKIKIKCLVCNTISEVLPDYYVNNKFSCKKCKQLKSVKNRFNKVFNNDYTYIIDDLDYIKITHLICGHTYNNDINKGKFTKCPKCKYLNRSKFFEKINNSNYELLSDYSGFSKNIKYKHLDCGTIIENTPSSFVKYKHNCPKCNPRRRKNINEIKQEIYDLVGDEYILLNKNYSSVDDIGVFKHISDKCLNSTFEMPIRHFIYSNNRCKNCRKKTTKMFKRDVYNKFKSEYVVVGEYTNNKTKIKVKHNSPYCNYSCFKITPNNLLKLKMCPKCKKINNISLGELQIKKYLDKNNIEYTREYRCLKNKDTGRYLPFDFAVFKSNKLFCLIEFDGIQHFEHNSFFEKRLSLDYRKKLDLIKTNWCIENNIKLVRIKYTEIKEIPEILKREIL